MVERRKYRFRAWDKHNRELFPVIMVGRGVVMVQDDLTERTLRLENVKLMQFSGILDCKEQEIYEGDILELIYDGTKLRKKVELDDGSFRLIAVDKSTIGPRLLTAEFINQTNACIVGNIFQTK